MGRRGLDRIVIGFITTYAMNAYHHSSCEVESLSWRSVLDTTLCDKVCHWFSPGTLVSSTNNTDRHHLAEILSKVAMNILIPNSLNTGNIDFLHHKHCSTESPTTHCLFRLIRHDTLFVQAHKTLRMLRLWNKVHSCIFTAV